MRKIIFTKYSNDRADCFSIRTDIWREEDGRRTVEKIPMHPRAKEHLEALGRWQEALDAVYGQQGIVMNRGKTLPGGGVELEYLQGETLEAKLDSLIAAKEEEEALRELKGFVEKVRGPVDRPFVMTDGFREVFGEAPLLEHMGGLKSLAVTDIDLICSNVILGEPMTVIDYEWCFGFPVPISYVVYRIIHYYIHTKSSRECLDEHQLFSWAGISPEEITVYREMERSFQNYINGTHVPLSRMYAEFGAGSLRIDEIVRSGHLGENNAALQVFYDRGAGFSPDDSFYLPLEEDGSIETAVALPKDVKCLRLDPGAEPGICRLERLCFIGEEGQETPMRFSSNGFRLEADAVYFAQEDPQIISKEIPEGTVKLEVSLQIHPADAFVMEKYLEKDREYRAARERYCRKIRDMESTKVWKAYRAYRRLLERKKL